MGAEVVAGEKVVAGFGNEVVAVVVVAVAAFGSDACVVEVAVVDTIAVEDTVVVAVAAVAECAQLVLKPAANFG